MNEKLHGSWARALIDEVPVGVVVFDQDMATITWANRRMAQLLGLADAAQLVGETARQDSPLFELFARPEALILPRADGGEVTLECHYQDYDGVPSGRAAFYTDCSDRQQLQERIERLSMTDPLTSTLNWRGILREVDIQVSRSRRYDNPLSLMFIDIKQEDQDCLLQASRSLREQIRWTDMLGRFEQQRFLLVLPETAEQAAQCLADKICSALGAVHEVSGLAEPLHARAAVVQWRKGEDTRLLLQRLDTAMRNRADAA